MGRNLFVSDERGEATQWWSRAHLNAPALVLVDRICDASEERRELRLRFDNLDAHQLILALRHCARYDRKAFFTSTSWLSWRDRRQRSSTLHPRILPRRPVGRACRIPTKTDVADQHIPLLRRSVCVDFGTSLLRFFFN
jgi:hypothetical protein